MEEAPDDQGTPKGNSRDQEGDVHVHTESHNQVHDVDKTLYDAEEFLTNFAGLREENEQLKAQNHQLELQLEKARQDLQEFSLEKDNLENQILQEREQNKEILWKLRSDFQKVQEERLQWKEKYLDCCMQSSSQPTGLSQSPTGSGGSTGKSPSLKRKQSQSSLLHDTDSFYSNLSTAFGLTEQEQQPVPVTNQLWDPETKRFECKECKATFRMFSDLQTHIDKNKCVKYIFQCPQCSVVFSNANTFTKHLKYHMGKSMLCDFCGDKFMHEKGLKRHIKMYHTDYTQSFQCQYCSKVFGRKTLLENHIRRHFDFRPFKCSHCEKCFKTRQYLTGHVNGVHRNDKQFVCGKCDARFSWRTTWKRHMQNHVVKANKKKNKKRGVGSSTVTVSTVVANLPANLQHLAHSAVQGSNLHQSVADLTMQNLAPLHHGQITVAHLTQNVGRLPQNVTQLAQNVTQLAQNVTQLQQNVTQLPQEVQNALQLSQNVAQLPQNVTQVPQGVAHLPQDVTQLEQNVAQLP